eukprot:4346883-Pyramimonas_sp.AAC.1
MHWRLGVILRPHPTLTQSRRPPAPPRQSEFGAGGGRGWGGPGRCPAEKQRRRAARSERRRSSRRGTDTAAL